MRVTIAITCDSSVSLDAQIVADNWRQILTSDPSLTNVVVNVSIEPPPAVLTATSPKTHPASHRYYAYKETILKALEDAVRRNKSFGKGTTSLRIKYRTTAGIETERVIVPLSIERGRYDALQNVSAYDKTNDAPRTFRINNIVWAEEVK